MLLWPLGPEIGSAVPVEGVWILGTRYLGFQQLLFFWVVVFLEGTAIVLAQMLHNGAEDYDQI